jgi:hypothetical protein
MLGFEIHLNSEPLCIAAFHGDGLLVAAVDHIYQEDPSLETFLRVLGSPRSVQENLYFAEKQLRPGDEVVIRIVETDRFTDPIRRQDVSVPSSN